MLGTYHILLNATANHHCQRPFLPNPGGPGGETGPGANVVETVGKVVVGADVVGADVVATVDIVG